MLPSDFVRSLTAGPPNPVYLFLGAEAYRRRVCRRKLIARALPESERDSGVTRHDMESVPLAEIIDDARSLTLFAPRRVIWAASAEAAVPRGRATRAGDPGLAALEAYLQSPSPSVVLVFEAARYSLEGEEKKKAERVRKYYGAIPDGQVVEFPPYKPYEAQRLAQELARRAGLKMRPAEAALLAEAAGYDAFRIDLEIEKLRLYAGEGGEVTAADIASLVPAAKVSTVFELVEALGRGDRRAALEMLDAVVREGAYLPLALSFLETQFRRALVVKEMRLQTAKEVQSFFRDAGARIWWRPAEQILKTAQTFSAAQLKAAVAQIHEADRLLRDANPGDRTVVEHFVLRLGKD